jgi:hypothetical protein
MIGYYNGIDGIKMIRSMNECWNQSVC